MTPEQIAELRKTKYADTSEYLSDRDVELLELNGQEFIDFIRKERGDLENALLELNRQPMQFIKNSRPKWEYKMIINYPTNEISPQQETPNELGELGWEEYAIVQIGNNIHHYFKRQKI